MSPVTDPTSPTASAPPVELRGACVTLGGRPIVRDVDLVVPAGQVVAILGANGSGKSTLVRSMVGLHPLTAGSARLFGKPLGRFREWHRLGYVPQRSSLTHGIPSTVAEVVAAGRVSRRTPFLPMRRDDREAIGRGLATVGLSDRAGHRVATLSGGQQQRVLIARTLAGEPDLLVLDEPNAGVDVASQEAIAAALTTLAHDGATIVVVLHELGPFADLIDRTVVLRSGRVVHDGPPSERHGHAAHHHRPPVPPVLGPAIEAPLDGA